MSIPFGQPGLALTVARRAIISALLGLLIPVAIPSLIAWREQERSQAMSSPTGHGAEADLCRTARTLVLVAVLLDSLYLIALVWAPLIRFDCIGVRAVHPFFFDSEPGLHSVHV